MITITNLSQDNDSDQSAMNAITGGASRRYFGLPGISRRRVQWLVKKGKLRTLLRIRRRNLQKGIF